MTQTYTRDEALRSALDYFEQDEIAANTWLKKYCLADNDDKPLEKSPDDMHRRMAKCFAEAEEHYRREFNEQKNGHKNLKLSEYGYNREDLDEEKIYLLFKDFRYVIPAGSVMSGLGNSKPLSLSNCWVIKGPEDSLEDIFRVCNEQSQLMKRRGGVGFDISGLRPSGSDVNNSAKTSSGAASFMELFSHVTNTISQNGRRGALMLSIDIKHPDALEFIVKKQDLAKVTGANVSVQIGDDFMKAVEEDGDYFQQWPTNAHINWGLTENMEQNAGGNFEYDKTYPMTYTVDRKPSVTKQGYLRRIKAKKLWESLIHCAWNTAEPGIIFKTRHHNYSPDGVYDEFRGTCTNPCGEIFMHEDSCRLIHVNLSSFINNPFTEKARLDEKKLYEVTYEAMRLGDDLVYLEEKAIRKILKKIENDGETGNSEYRLYERLLGNSLKGRRCGLGFLGLSDAIAKLGLKYDSDEAIEMISHIMDVMFVAEMDCQIDMALTRGAFPAFSRTAEEKSGNEWYEMLKRDFPELYKKNMAYGRRNISFNTVAPTGTVSLMAKASSGIEPVFMPYYTRRVKCMSDGDKVDYIDQTGEKFTEYVVVHPALKMWAEVKYGDISTWSKDKWEQVFSESPWFGSTAQEIDWVQRVKLQGAVQKRITHSISSTVNLPSTVTEDEVSTIYTTAWKENLKGITVYRDGCRSGVLVTSDSKDDKKKEAPSPVILIKRRPKTLECKIFRFINKGEKWVSVVGMMDGEPYEIFSGVLEKLNIPNWVDEGYIIKNYETTKNEDTGEDIKQSRYDICYIDKDGYKVCVEGLSRIFNPEYWNYAKLISGLLRHGMGVKYIIKVISSLKLDSTTINTWKNGIIRTLRKFEKDDQEVLSEKCPECGGRIIREGGCVHCADCAWSRCE